MNASNMVPTQRAFTFGISAGARSILLALRPLSSVAVRSVEPKGEPQGSGSEISAWIVIEPDETTIIRVSRSEMGQGNFTTLPTLVAEELECDRRFVRPEGIDPSENIARGHPGAEMVTAASISVCGSQTYMRKANFHDYRALRTNETPQVETHFLFSENRYTEEWGGVGEPGTPPLEAAISNAVFAATGQRIRSLPFANH